MTGLRGSDVADAAAGRTRRLCDCHRPHAFSQEVCDRGIQVHRDGYRVGGRRGQRDRKGEGDWYYQV